VWGSVTTADALAEAGVGHQLRHQRQVEGVRVELLVHVQVERPVQLGGQAHAVLEAGDRVGVEVRAAAHHVDACLHRLAEQRPVGGTACARHGPLDEGHELEVDLVAEGSLGRQHALHGGEPDAGAEVHVGADGGAAVGEQPPGPLLGPPGDVGGGERGLEGHPRVDGAEQVAGGVRHQVGGERLVEVGVRLGRRGQQEAAAQVHHLLARLRGERAHGQHLLGVHADVGGGAVGEEGRAQQHGDP